jgi:fibronectin type 3 domain-containing protein
MKYVLILFLLSCRTLFGATLPKSTSHEVNLTWSAPVNSTDPVAGYDIFKALDGTGDYGELGSVVIPTTSFVDNTSFSYGATYDYYVTSVDANDIQSGPSNIATIKIPFVPNAPIVGTIKGT